MGVQDTHGQAVGKFGRGQKPCTGKSTARQKHTRFAESERDKTEKREIDKCSSRDTETPLLLNTWAISLDQLGYRNTT